MFAGHQVTDQNEIMQAVWVYEHPVDFDGLRRMHDNLGRGLLGRRIERSALPFGRHRWVSGSGAPDLDVAESARPRAEVTDWADERAQLPIDAERGPGWHLGVLPLTDGSTAVSLVASHYLLDGIGLFVALFEAAVGHQRDLGYPPPGSRSRLRAIAQDARQTARDAPEVVRALVAAAKMGREYWRQTDRPPAPEAVTVRATDQDEPEEKPAVVPWVSIHVKLDEWEARAQALEGTSNTLAAGFAAKLGQRMGRLRPDGAVTLLILASQRTPDDTRALALSYPRVIVDAARVTTDLRDARAAVKQALKTQRETADESMRFAPLTLFTPKRILKQMVEASLIEPDRPVVYSHLGDPPPGARGIDGTDAEYITARGTKQHLTRRWLEQTGGQAILLSGRFPERISMTFQAYQPGAENTKAALRELVASALAEFGLTAEID